MIELPDEFASGENTRLRTWLARLGRALFAPPYLPAGLIGLAVLIMATDAVLTLLRQLPDYWGEYRPLAEAIGWDSGPLDAGPWVFMLIALAYIAAIVLALAVLHRPVAYFGWLLVCAMHVADFGSGWRCGPGTNLPMLDRSACLPFAYGALALSALVFGLGLAYSSSALKEEPVSSQRNKITLGIYLVWSAVLCATFIGMVAAPRPRWIRLQPAHAPSARTSAAMSYDARGHAILFGGAPGWSGPDWIANAETWEWDGSDWTQLHPRRSPAARLDSAMVYDEGRGVSVLFGGVNHGRSRGDTWEWDGSNWSQIMPEHSPAPRCCFDMYYDRERKTVVLYGGFAARTSAGAGDVFYNDMWEWDGKDWQFVARDEKLSDNTFTLVYDPLRRTALMFEGHGAFVWQDDKWQQLESLHAPAGRWSSAMTFLPGRGLVLLFGGSMRKTYFDDTWLYDGAAWEKAPILERPPARENPVLFYDAPTKRIIMFGGYANAKLYNDTWELILP